MIPTDHQDWDEFEVVASRATDPYFYHAPYPEQMQPYGYQLGGVEYHLRRDHALFGDAPGLGKTAECVMLGNAIGARHSIVVCPASLVLNWEKEIWKWSTLPNVSTYPVRKSSDGVSHAANYVILSYAMLTNPSILHALMARTWDHLILDEAHALKDPKGNTRTKVICAPDLLPSVVGRITMASGTILPNQPIECYNAFRLLDWDGIDRCSLEEFRETYYGEGSGMVRGPVTENGVRVWKLHWSDEVLNVPRNLEDLQYRLRKSIMVRRLKEQVLHELPPKVWHPVPLSVTADIKRAMAHPGWKEASKLYDMDAGAFNAGIPIDGAISTARLELGKAKAPGVLAYIHDLLEGGVEKLVVGAWHREVLASLREGLQSFGLAYMDGSTSLNRKQAAVDSFQQDPAIRVILGQTQVLGEGWTLTAAQDLVNAEPDWVPGRNDQLLDRIHRLGQKGNYLIGHLPVAAGTLDERIVARAIEKDKHIHSTLDRRVA